MNKIKSPIAGIWPSAVLLLVVGGAALAGRLLYGPIAAVSGSAPNPDSPASVVTLPTIVAAPAVSASGLDVDDLDCDVSFEGISLDVQVNRLTLQMRRMDAEDEPLSVSLRFPWATAGFRHATFDSVIRRPPGMVHGDLEQWIRMLPDGIPSEYYSDIRTGIDLLHYTSGRRNEIVFIRWPGTDRMPLEIHSDDPLIGIASDLASWQIGDCRLVLGPPTVGQFDRHGISMTVTDWQALGPGAALELPPVDARPDEESLEPEWRLVPGGGQPGGPEYGFYLSQHSVTQAEYMRFLNDAQLHSDTPRGQNMYFDDEGNVWINPAMRVGEHEMFRISDSHLEYDADAPIGQRYRVVEREGEEGGGYSNHPATGVSWFGSLKYCNWLTLASGRGTAALCYREGPDPFDWAPVTSHPTNWINGRFTADERNAWLDVPGIRLPMDDSTGVVSRASTYSEYYKAASWDGVTNTVYGFGRDEIGPLDANYRMTALNETLPVGFFDGQNEIQGQLTRPNQNRFAIFDLSGNVSEWLSCPPDADARLLRNRRGGGWGSVADTLHADERWTAPPHQIGSSGGFRVLTMAADLDMHVIRIPYRICCPRLVEEPEEDPPTEVEDPPDPFDDDPVVTPPGIRYRDPPGPPFTPPGPPPFPPPPPPSPSLT